ncbi:hypothetical protein GCM10027610_010220 [Dactylosporangium cerinum]
MTRETTASRMRMTASPPSERNERRYVSTPSPSVVTVQPSTMRAGAAVVALVVGVGPRCVAGLKLQGGRWRRWQGKQKKGLGAAG